MNIRRRLDGLERIVERMDMSERCLTCGYPGSQKCAVIVVFDCTEPARCPTCANLVDESGRSVGRQCVVLAGPREEKRHAVR